MSSRLLRSAWLLALLLGVALLAAPLAAEEAPAPASPEPAEVPEGVEVLMTPAEGVPGEGGAPEAEGGFVETDPITGEALPSPRYCYKRVDMSCGSCSFYASCLVYGWDNRFGQECYGREIEYCDGVPTGREWPIARLYCGC